MKKIMLYLLLSASPTSLIAGVPAFNGPPSTVNFSNYRILSEDTVPVMTNEHTKSLISSKTYEITLVRTFNPDLGLVVASYGNGDPTRQISSGNVAHCKQSTETSQRYQYLVLQSTKLVMMITAGHSTDSLSSDQASIIEFMKHVFRFSQEVGSLPVIWCSPMYK